MADGCIIIHFPDGPSIRTRPAQIVYTKSIAPVTETVVGSGAPSPSLSSSNLTHSLSAGNPSAITVSGVKIILRAKNNPEPTRKIRDSIAILSLTLIPGLKSDKPWFEAFDDAPSRDVNYLRKMRKNGEKLNEEPRITLSTIHGAKGGESQNVVLLTDLSENTMKAYEKNPDDENRLFYVGATRTKEHLHIISPKQEYKGYSI